MAMQWQLMAIGGAADFPLQTYRRLPLLGPPPPPPPPPHPLAIGVDAILKRTQDGPSFLRRRQPQRRTGNKLWGVVVAPQFNSSEAERKSGLARALRDGAAACPGPGPGMEEEGWRSPRKNLNMDGDEEEDGGDRDREILRLMEDGATDIYPMVRTYRNDLCTLEICGFAPRAQALAAMASDPSFTAATNIILGRPLTVLQTVVPGSSTRNSTVSTKLFAPSKLVVEAARKFIRPKGAPASKFMRGLFEAVQMCNFSKFYLEFHAPGTKRDMSALLHEEKAQLQGSLESADEKVLKQLAKAVSLYALDCSRIKESLSNWERFWKILQKPTFLPSLSASLRVRTLSEAEILNEIEQLKKDSFPAKSIVDMDGHSWWPAPPYLLDVVRTSVGLDKETWAFDYLPSHKLQVDFSTLNIKVAGGDMLSHHTWEILLSHAQMIDLAGVLDLFYEDVFTCPEKELTTGVTLSFKDFSRSKFSQLIHGGAIGSLVVGTLLFGWLVALRVRPLPAKWQPHWLTSPPNVVTNSTKEACKIEEKTKPLLPINEAVPAEEMESLCRVVVDKVAESWKLSWPVQSSPEQGAWLGDEQVPRDATGLVIENAVEAESNISANPDAKEDGIEEATSSCPSSEVVTETLEETNSLGLDQDTSDASKTPAFSNEKDWLIYQVVLTRNGDLIGFSPSNLTAVRHWANLPFAEILHKGRKLRPGFFEWPLKLSEVPRDAAIVIELRILMDSVTRFVHAKPVRIEDG